MARIAIVGPGAVGGVAAAWLAHTGRHQIVLCARRPTSGELRVEIPGGLLVSQPRILSAPEEATPVDWVLVATKAYDTAGAAAWLPGLGEAAPVAVLQNGVEHRERFAPYLPAERLLPVVVDVSCERRAPLAIRQRGPGRMTVPDDEIGRAFVSLFAGGALDVATTPDFRSAAWRKLCRNAAGVISALVLQPARVMRDEEIGELCRQIVRETIAVGRAEGAVLDDSLVEGVLQACRASAPDSVNSLHADRAAGRPMEIDARNGVIVRLGRRHGIATPCNQMAVALLGAMARG